MKKSILIFFLFVSTLSQAQSEKYVAAMKKNLALMDSAKTVQDLQNVANAFARIAEAEKTQWLPYYYSGLSLSLIGWMDPKLDKDANSAKINALCDKAEALEKNAEIYALRNISATQAMLVDPQSRWQTNGMEAKADLEEGLKLDPNNPRLYYLQGMALFGTPESFGGGKAVAKPLFEKALSLFKTYPVKPLYPNWGEKRTETMLAQCQ